MTGALILLISTSNKTSDFSDDFNNDFGEGASHELSINISSRSSILNLKLEISKAVVAKTVLLDTRYVQQSLEQTRNIG